MRETPLITLCRRRGFALVGEDAQRKPFEVGKVEGAVGILGVSISPGKLRDQIEKGFCMRLDLGQSLLPLRGGKFQRLAPAPFLIW